MAGLRAAGVPLRRDGSAEQRYDLLRGEWDTASSTLLRHDGDDEHHRVGDAR